MWGGDARDAPAGRLYFELGGLVEDDDEAFGAVHADCHRLLDVGGFAGAADEGDVAGRGGLAGGGPGEEVAGEFAGGQEDDVDGRQQSCQPAFARAAADDDGASFGQARVAAADADVGKDAEFAQTAFGFFDDVPVDSGEGGGQVEFGERWFVVGNGRFRPQSRQQFSQCRNGRFQPICPNDLTMNGR